MSSGGRGGSSRRKSRRKERDDGHWAEMLPGGAKKRNDKLRYDKQKGTIYERPRWVPVKPPAEPLPAPDCPLCGKPVRDLATAVTDKNSGEPAHFECVASWIAQGELLEKGESIAYIGGGRFGILHYSNPQDTKRFIIKKILEWEDKDNRALWRKTVADHYSVT